VTIGALRSNTLYFRVLKYFYLTAVTVATIGWLWLLAVGLAWALDI
jgi:hypothetical protein